MTTTTTDTQDFLHAMTNTSRRRRRVGMLARLWRSLAVWLAIVWVVLIVDAAWPLAAQVRLVLVVLLATGLWWLILASRTRRRDERHERLHEAQQLEQRYDITHNTFINAASLWPIAAETGQSYPTLLAQRSLARADTVVGHLDFSRAIDRRPVKLAMLSFAFACVPWLIVTLWQPHLLTGGFARLIAPFGDHPHFSLTRIELTASSQRVETGGSVTLTATLSGRLVDEAMLAEVDANGNVLRRQPMRMTGEGVFERMLVDLHEPMTLQVEAGGGRSKRLTITPVAPPPSPTPSSPTDAPVADGTQSRTTDTQSAAAIAGLRELAMKAQGIADDAASLRAMLDALTPDAFTQRMDALLAQLQTFARRAGAIADAAGQTTDELFGGSLNLPGMASLSQPGEGAGSAAIAGYLSRIRAAAVADREQLANVLAAMPQGMMMWGESMAETDTAPHTRTSTRQGRYDEQVDGADTLREVDVRLQQAPPMYRAMVGQYYQRIAEDQSE